MNDNTIKNKNATIAMISLFSTGGLQMKGGGARLVNANLISIGPKQTVSEKKLTYKKRKSLPKKSFAIPGKRKYPIHDKAHARNALARVSAHGTPQEKRQVRAAVKRRYPGIEVSNGKK